MSNYLFLSRRMPDSGPSYSLSLLIFPIYLEMSHPVDIAEYLPSPLPKLKYLPHSWRSGLPISVPWCPSTLFMMLTLTTSVSATPLQKSVEKECPAVRVRLRGGGRLFLWGLFLQRVFCVCVAAQDFMKGPEGRAARTMRRGSLQSE